MAENSDADTRLKIGERLDMVGARELHGALMERRGRDLELDAGDLVHIGALGLQVLRAASRSWYEAGNRLAIANLSADCADQLALFGFSPESVTDWESA